MYFDGFLVDGFWGSVLGVYCFGCFGRSLGIYWVVLITMLRI